MKTPKAFSIIRKTQTQPPTLALPLRIHQNCVVDADERMLFIRSVGMDETTAIVTACNAHAALVAACEDALQSLNRLPNVDGAFRVTAIQQIEAALALARTAQTTGKNE